MMGDENDRAAVFIQAPDHIHHAALFTVVQPGGGLVGIKTSGSEASTEATATR